MHTHHEITERAKKIWMDHGKPVGRDLEIWLEAERLITNRSQTAKTVSETDKALPGGQGQKTGTISASQVTADAAVESAVEFHISPAVADEKAIKAALQASEARAPKTPHKAAPRQAPPESGKPLWSKPHSS